MYMQIPPVKALRKDDVRFRMNDIIRNHPTISRENEERIDTITRTVLDNHSDRLETSCIRDSISYRYKNGVSYGKTKE